MKILYIFDQYIPKFLENIILIQYDFLNAYNSN